MKPVIIYFISVTTLIRSVESSKFNISLTLESNLSALFSVMPCAEFHNNATKLLKRGEISRAVMNPYLVYIDHVFKRGAEVTVTLGAPGQVRFFQLEPIVDDVHVESTSNFTIVLRYHNDSVLGQLVLELERAVPTVVPYIETLEIDGIEYCKGETVTVVNLSPHYTDFPLDFIKTLKPITLPAPIDICGTKNVTHSEQNGKGLETNPGDWPWNTAIYKINKTTSTHICGGTLISKFFILTAARCVVNNGFPVLPDTRNVVLGKYKLRGGDTTAVEKEIHEIIVYDKYKDNIQKHDIAMLKLATEVEFNNFIRPACLWQNGLKYNLPEKVYGTVVGWGIDHSNQLSKKLQQVEVPILDGDLCLKSNPAHFGPLLDENNFCAGDLNSSTSACKGDSGGGLTIQVKGKYYIRGIISRASVDLEKCDPYQYTLLTDLEMYTKWILANIK